MNKVIIKKCLKIETKNSSGERNGDLFPILSSRYNEDGFLDKTGVEKFNQIYMTTLDANVFKGFHVHKDKVDNFFCVKGEVEVYIYDVELDPGQQINAEEFDLSKIKKIKCKEDEVIVCKIPPRKAHGILNLNSDEARVCNYCYPAWNNDKPDQWDIVDSDNIIKKILNG